MAGADIELAASGVGPLFCATAALEQKSSVKQQVSERRMFEAINLSPTLFLHCEAN